MGNSEETPEKSGQVADKQPEPPKKNIQAVSFIYKFGFYTFLFTSIFSTYMLLRLLKTSETLLQDFARLQTSNQKLTEACDDLAVFAQRRNDQVKECIQSLNKLNSIADGCLAEMKGSTSTMAETVESLNSLNACTEQLVYVKRQNTLEIAKLLSAYESCDEERAKLQKQLLRPCPGM